MLSADGDVLLFTVKKEIIDNFDDLLDSFFSSLITKSYDEQLFVEFIKNKYGEDSIRLEKNLGTFDEYNIPMEYKNIKWFNF